MISDVLGLWRNRLALPAHNRQGLGSSPRKPIKFKTRSHITLRVRDISVTAFYITVYVCALMCDELHVAPDTDTEMACTVRCIEDDTNCQENER